MRSQNRKPFIIPIFLPNLGCPHRCIFCDQAAITANHRTGLSADQLHDTVNTYLKYKGRHRNRVQISFYGGNFLGLDRSFLLLLMEEATRFVQIGDVENLRFSTRPDTVTRKQLDVIRDYPVTTIELGVQSMDDGVLKMVRRGHSVRDTEKAVHLLKEKGYEVGLQMMVGLPGDDHESALKTARKMIGLSPDFVRIYPTIVLANSPLASWYRKGKYTPLPLSTSVTLVKQLYALFHQHHIRVVRMGLQASEELNNPTTVLAGPYHPAFGHLVLSEYFLDIAASRLTSMPRHTPRICIKVHPQNESKLRGFKNQNLSILKNRFNITSLEITPDISLGTDDLAVSGL